jgi:hypothetical protein
MSDKPVADQAKDTAQSAKEQVAGTFGTTQRPLPGS